MVGDLNREAAEHIKRRLEEAGAEAQVVSTGETVNDSRADALKSRVRSMESGVPVAGATVIIQPATSEVDATLGETTTNEDGIFTMDRFGSLVREYFSEKRSRCKSPSNIKQEEKIRHRFINDSPTLMAFPLKN